MYRYYFDGRKIRFYPMAVVCGENVYGARDEADAERIKARLMRRRGESGQAGDGLAFETVSLDMPDTTQLGRIQLRTFNDSEEALEFAESVLSGEAKPTQEEINAKFMLEIAKLKAGVLNV